MQDQTKRIGLGVITHQRPDGLTALINSFANMKVPDGVVCVLLIAENDDLQNMRSVVEGLEDGLPFEVRLSLETERGIPFARNHVLDMARSEGCDYLTFVDDDQVVHEDWLVMLYATVAGRGLDIGGGPITMIADPTRPTTWEHRAVLADINKVLMWRQRQKNQSVGTMKEAAQPIYTNNWMLRMAAQERLGTRFDEKLRFTGGSDTKFFWDFSTAGATTGWSSDARVTEIWPLERLTLKYLFRRARDQHLAELKRRRQPLRYAAAIGALVLSAVVAFGFVLQSPFNDYRTLPRAARSLGSGVAKVRACGGRLSRLYAPAHAKSKM